jgi:hypothetical protein
MKDITGGYLKLKRMQQRYSDGAMIVQVTWVKPVMIEEAPAEEPKTKSKASSAKATEAQSEVKKPSKSVKKTK